MDGGLDWIGLHELSSITGVFHEVRHEDEDGD